MVFRNNGHDPELGTSPEAKTYARAVDPKFQAKLDAIKEQLLGGGAMSDDDIEAVTQLGLLDLLDSKRPAVRLQALKLLQEQRSKKLAAKGQGAGAGGPEDPKASGLNLPDS